MTYRNGRRTRQAPLDDEDADWENEHDIIESLREEAANERLNQHKKDVLKWRRKLRSTLQYIP
jgi:hypothetical protein